ncbi:MAG: arsenate reductase [Micavibrio sp.]|nr:MAG: arsenate reductase [Micavibrio sp.]
MTTKIYYNGKCGTCRNTLAILTEAGHEPELINYLKDTPTKEELSSLIDQMGVEPREAMRAKEAVYKELALDNPNLSRSELIEAMVDNPILIQRPIVVTDKGAAICRPAENVKALL